MQLDFTRVSQKYNFVLVLPQSETERILETMEQTTETNPHQLIHELRERVNAFCGNEPQRDDITIIGTHLS